MDERERLLRWIEESKDLFARLPLLLNNDQKTTAELLKECEALKKQLEEVRKQNEVLRAEKDEAAQALARMLETVQATNQIAQKLGVTKSPFARRSEAAPAAAPNPAPHE